MGKGLGVGNKSSQEDIIRLNIKNCFFCFQRCVLLECGLRHFLWILLLIECSKCTIV